VRSEDASQDVSLVYSHELEVAQEVAPGLVVRQDADVQHVRVRQDDVRLAAHLGPQRCRRIAVVGCRVDAAQLEGTDLPELILGQRLGRVQEQRPARRTPQGVL
jgi:hypothetical protein